MSRAVRISNLMLAAAVVVSALGHIAFAVDFEPAPTQIRDSQTIGTVPNRWNEDEANVRPLPTADPYSGTRGASDTTGPPAELQYPQRTALTQEQTSATDTGGQQLPANSAQPLPLARPSSDETPSTGPVRQLQPLTKGAASLGIVVGLFLLVVLVTRRGMPKGAATLPSEVAEVLGRVPLVGRQQAYLVRCANKLLLVSATPQGVRTLTEITDPAEVDNMIELCQGSGNTHSGFRQVIGHAGQGPRNRRYAARHQASEIDFSNLDSGHRAEEVRS